MIRAVAKGAVLFAFGRTPCGAKLYRWLTRQALGTQATHVDKLARVFPGYVDVWERLGVPLEGSRIWIHEGGWTPFPFLAAWLATGVGPVVTNHEGRLSKRYVAHAVESAAALERPRNAAWEERRSCLKQVRQSLLQMEPKEIVDWVRGEYRLVQELQDIPVEDSSADLVHSGGILEHYRPEALSSFLSETFRILKPGGWCSHVLDHRDHLYHADKGIAFMNHLRFAERSYSFWMGHTLLYHSRLTPAEIGKLFEDVGYERRIIRRMILPYATDVETDEEVLEDGFEGRLIRLISFPPAKYVETDDEIFGGRPGLDRLNLSPRFLDISEVDLRTAACHYLFQKPA